MQQCKKSTYKVINDDDVTRENCKENYQNLHQIPDHP